MAMKSSSPMEESPIVTTAAVVWPDVIHSHSGLGENLGNSSRSRKGGKLVSAASPWTQIVRGESDSIAAVPSSPSTVERVTVVGHSSSSSSSSSLIADEDNSESGTGVSASNAGKKLAWNKPSNGSSSPELTGVMGAESWPALSESARAPSKPYLDPLKGLSDGSLSVQGVELVSSNLQNSKQVIDNPSFGVTSNNAISTQRSFKKNGSQPTPNGSTSQPYSSHVLGDTNLNNAFPRDQTQRSSQARGTNDNQQQRNSYRTRGPARGDSVQHNSYGARRDHDRGNQDLNNRNFSNRDSNLQSQRGVPRFVRQPPPPPPPIPTSTPFIVPATVRTFGPPIGYPDYHMYYFPPPVDSFRGMPFFPAPMSPVYVPPGTDPLLQSKILHQIEYYFSNENLVKDTYLRQNMDEQGWVAISLIANFNKVAQLTDNIPLILESVRASMVVEVQGDRVRRRNDWIKWILTPTYPKSTSSGNSSYDVSESMQNLSLEQSIGPSSARKQVETSIDVSLNTNQETTPVSNVVDPSHSSVRNSG